MRIGINGSDKLAAPDLGRLVADVVAAEADGFGSYWLAQTGLVDAAMVLAMAGKRTSTIELGTAVVPTWERHPRGSPRRRSLRRRRVVGGSRWASGCRTGRSSRECCA